MMNEEHVYDMNNEIVNNTTEEIMGRIAQYTQGLITQPELLMTIHEMFGSDVIQAIIVVHAIDTRNAEKNL